MKRLIFALLLVAPLHSQTTNVVGGPMTKVGAGTGKTKVSATTNTFPSLSNLVARWQTPISGATDGNTFSPWYDSVASYDLSQSTVGNRATYHVNYVNANDGASFDGGDYYPTGGPSDHTAPYLLWGVVKRTSGSGSGTIIGQGGNGGLIMYIDGGSHNVIFSNNFSFIGQSSSPIPEDAWCSVIGTYTDAGTYAFYINGILSGSGTHSVTLSGANTFQLGAFQGVAQWTGSMAEAGVCNSVNTPALIQQLHTYLATRYGLPDLGYSIIQSSIAGQNYQIMLPTSRITGTAIIYCHGAGETYTSPLNGSSEAPYFGALAKAGYLVASSDAHGDNWGNDAAVTDYESLHTLLVSSYSVTKTVLAGLSMGGFPSCQLVKNGNITTLVGWMGLKPAVNLANMYAGVYQTSINTAYNIPGGGNYATQTAGHDPVLYSASVFNGLRMRFYASPSDTVVTKVDNSDQLATLVSGHATESTVVYCSGEHDSASYYQLADIKNFLLRCF